MKIPTIAYLAITIPTLVFAFYLLEEETGIATAVIVGYLLVSNLYLMGKEKQWK